MSLRKTVTLFTVAWLVVITLLHSALNLHAFNRPAVASRHATYHLGFLPVTCHLTCPVADFINRQQTGVGIFEPVKFQSWPELKEAFLSGHTSATFHPRADGHGLARTGRADQDRLPRPPRRLGGDGPQGFEHPFHAGPARQARRGPEPLFQPTPAHLPRAQAGGHDGQRHPTRRDAAAGHARRAVFQIRGRHFQRRAVHGVRPRWTATAACSG